MKANTAVCLGLVAVCIWLSRTTLSRRKKFAYVWLMAGLVTLTATITISEYIFHWNSGIDELFFRDLEHIGTGYPPGRFAPGTAFCLVTLCGAIALLDWKPRLSHALNLIAAMGALIALIGYLYNLPTLYAAVRFTSLAFHTIIGLLTLNIGLLACRPQRGITKLILVSEEQHSPFRALLAGAVLLPMLLGSLALSGQRMGFYGSEFTLALFSVLLIVLTLALVWITGEETHRAEAKRREAANSLRESEERFRTLADNIPTLASMAHPDGSVFWHNKRWCEYTGLTPDQLAGWRWKEVLDTNEAASIIDNWKKAARNFSPSELVCNLRGRDGVSRPFLTRAQPVMNAQGKAARWFVTSTDISHEREAQEQLRRANRQLEEYAFVSAHDLQEPLRMVCINSELLISELNGNITDEAREHAALVKQSVMQMGQMIADLLAFSRTITAPVGSEISGASADLNICLQKALSALAVPLVETGARIIADPLPVVFGETIQLTQIFQNLLSNSLKYKRADRKPEINISAEARDAEWIICVEDNGIGFDPKYSDRIFKLFKRLHKDEYPGTGLGLAICQRIVERYGGRIWTESTLGVGSRFYLSLPSASPAAARTLAASGARVSK